MILRAETDIPATDYYGDFGLTENGIGLLREFLDSFESNLNVLKSSPKSTGSPKLKSLIVTATDSGRFFKKSILPQLPEEMQSIVSIAIVKNQFLGKDVTVAGLLSGKDIENSLVNEFREACNNAEQILICDCCLNDENRFIDNVSVDALSKAIGKPVIAVANDGLEFIEALKKE